VDSPMIDTTDTARDDVPTLQHALIDKLTRAGHMRSPRVEAAFRAVPRHLFVPDVPLAQVYSDTSLVTKTIDGRDVSSSSQPTMMAIMLEQLALHPGQRVLEIGAGTGYNAALMAHIVGEHGLVVTIDIDEDIVAAAQAHLAAAGYAHVQVICSDGGLGYADVAPYDRIIVTVGADDLPPAWSEQLRPVGRLVVPLGFTQLDTVTGSKTLVTFEHVDDHLESRVLSSCGFVPLRGAFGAMPVVPVSLGPTPQLDLITDGLVEAEQLYAALVGPHRDDAVGVAITPREVWGLRLWLALHERHFCDLSARGDSAGQDRVPFFMGQPGAVVATVGLCVAATLSLVTYKPDQAPVADEPFNPDRSRVLMTRTFGVDGELAQRLIAQIIAWEQAGRPFAFDERWTVAGPRLRVYARDAAYVPSLYEAIIEQRSAQLVFNWERQRP